MVFIPRSSICDDDVVQDQLETSDDVSNSSDYVDFEDSSSAPFVEIQDVSEIQVAIYQASPIVTPLAAVKRFFHYLRGNPDIGLWYPKEDSFDFIDFSYSDYGLCKINFKSTTLACQCLGNRLVSRQCKKQTNVSTSTVEAEYVATLICCSHFLGIQQHLRYGRGMTIDAPAREEPQPDVPAEEIQIVELPYDKKIDLCILGRKEKQIEAEIHNKKIIVDVELIQKVLQFLDTVDDRCEFDKEFIKGLLGHLKYKGDLEKPRYYKNKLLFKG
ncbi:uncharacterized protein LOC143637121 [Bidens hawaiensis]|uniref:uncharacterized protein LOC143637121 n=1 Tax=Bidens hawaiensis TaxID=980011 RepID=UPI0040491036